MTKTLLYLFLFNLLIIRIDAQQLNQPANWPSENWTLSGSYEIEYLYANPTIIGGSSSFSFNDDEAGGSSINSIAAESPYIDLTNAYTNGETSIIVSFSYVLNIYQEESLSLQFWDEDTSSWIDVDSDIYDNSNAQENFCIASPTTYTSSIIDIANFSTNQLQNFKYRIFYNDNSSYGWGFCVDSPTIFSEMPPACPNITSLAVSGISATQANVNWSYGGTETSWEIAIRLTSEAPPTSGVIASTNSFSFSELSQETTYTVYVRANCLEDGFSNWISQNFTTGFDDSTYPVTFTPNPIATSGSYDIALVDLNGDFLDDIISVSSNNINVHYQLPTGGFSMSNITTPNANFLPTWSLAVGDFDRNGYNDLLYGSGNGVTFMKANSSGNGYSEISGPEDVFSQRSNFIDINNDGHLDAFVCHDVEPNVYYINDGLGNLTYYQGQSALLPNGVGTIPGGGNYGTVWIDFDNDRDMDMFIAKCRGSSDLISTNELWRNDGNGVFVNIADSQNWYASNYPSVGHDNSSNLGDIIQTWSSAWADFDNDGDMDVFVGASNASNGGSKLMMNNGDGTFTDVTSGSGVLAANMGIENAPADFDNDGYVDILSNGDILFNNGDFTFSNYSTGMPPSGAIGDANNDGFLDVFRSGNIYLNNTNSNNWITINTVGTASNINGIGARVEIHTPSGMQIRDVRSGEGFEFMSTLNTHFGIGTDTAINNITIYWPSGIVDYIENPSINTTHNIVEGSSLSVFDETLVDLSIYPNPVEDELQIQTSGNVINKIATIFDINGKRVLNLKLDSTSIDVSSLTSGVYFLRLESDGKIAKRKFIKK